MQVRLPTEPVAVAILAAATIGATCRGGATHGVASVPGIVDLPGIDTHDFTPREKRELSQYVSEFPAPCPEVAVPLAQCVLERRSCAACAPAAAVVAKAVRDGLTREQVRDVYKERFGPLSTRSIPLEGSPTRGPDLARVIVVEFADFECPFCQKLAPELDRVWEKRKDKVRFVFKFLPLSMHPHGELAARAAIAAKMQGKFWEMHHALFTEGRGLEESQLVERAQEIGLDIGRFRADMAGADATARIDADRKLADALSIKGTPTIFIDGREYDMKIDLGDWIDGEIAAAAEH